MATIPDVTPKQLEEFQQMMRRLERLPKLANEPATGQTPKELIWTKNKSRLWRYRRQAEKVHPTPILMTYALINRPYILDLAPGKSLIEYLVNQGFDVFLIEWGDPGDEDQNLKIDDYIVDYMPKFVRKTLRTAKADSLTLLGYCMGGTMTVIHTALYQDIEPIRNVVLLTAPVDFSDLGKYTLWIDEKHYNVDKVVETLGNVPPELIDWGNKMQNPVANYLLTYVNLWENLTNERFVENWQLVYKWVNDGVVFPKEAFRQWIKDYYQKNKLIKGELVVAGQRVDLSKIRVPLFAAAGKTDIIAPVCSSEGLMSLVASTDKEYVIVPGGHISLVSGSAARQFWPKLADWLAKRSD